MMGNLLGAAQRAASTTTQQVQANNPVAIGGLGALAGTLLGGGKGAIGGGVLAVLGSLAYSALQRASQPATANEVSAGTGGAPVSQVISGSSEDVRGTATLLLRAMISAAKADGRGRSINWSRVDGLRRFGGIRIEDDLAVTATGCENLTRHAFAQSAG